MTAGRLYITPDDYVFAEKNGIPSKNVWYRVEVQGWSIERAISTPLRKTGNYGWEEQKDLAALCGVKYTTYRRRVLDGWEHERAATTAPRPKKKVK